MREVIEFWRAVEMFSPPAIPAARPAQRVFDVEAGEPLPWDPGHPVQATRLTKDQAWRHTVYVGLYPREAVFSALKDVFPPATDSYEERPSGQSALLGFAVSEDGILLEGSAVLSACAWATARGTDPGPATAGWLDGFAGLQRAFSLGLEETLLGKAEERHEPVVLDWSLLDECRGGAIAALGVDDVLPVAGLRVSSEIVARRSADTVEHDFLNSFIADDLARVAAAVGAGDVGAALRDYLRPTAELDVGGHIDVRTRLDEVRRATGPDRLPTGRWPARPDRPLALGQQLAVDEAIAMPRAGGHLFAVNGPPGTGKTTMLRDLLAALVTERAERLAALDDPAEAFKAEPEGWETTPYRRVIHRLRPELTGFELVLASSNNGAVENVTLEIPSSEAIDAPWRERAEEVDYFPALAGRAMSAGRTLSGAWGLVAARLGNSRNRKDFVNAVWWTERRKKGDKRPPPPPGLRDLLGKWEKHPEGPSWAEAVGAFERARERERAIRADRRHAATALDRVAALESQIEAARAAERDASDRVEASRPRREELASAQGTREDERRRRIEAREEELRRRPSVLRFRARAAWRQRDGELAAAIADLDWALDEIGEELRALEGEVRVQAEASAALPPPRRRSPRPVRSSRATGSSPAPSCRMASGSRTAKHASGRRHGPTRSGTKPGPSFSSRPSPSTGRSSSTLRSRCARPSTERWTSSPAGRRATSPARPRSPPGRRSSCSSRWSRRPSPPSAACSGDSALGRSAGWRSTRPARARRRTRWGRCGAAGGRWSLATRSSWSRSRRSPSRSSRRSASTTGSRRSG